MKCRDHQCRCMCGDFDVAAPLMLNAQQPGARDSLRPRGPAEPRGATRPAHPAARLLSSQSALRMQDIDASRLPTESALTRRRSTIASRNDPAPAPERTMISRSAARHVRCARWCPAAHLRPDSERAARCRARAACGVKAGVQASSFALRQNVNDAYFSALLQQAQHCRTGDRDHGPSVRGERSPPAA